MLFLLGGSNKKNNKPKKDINAVKKNESDAKVKELFFAGKFPVVTTHAVEGRNVAKVLGLVCCRGYDSEEAFFGMTARAMKKGAQAIIGYCENVAFHPDGSKYFSCYGTAVVFEYDPTDRESFPLHLGMVRGDRGLSNSLRNDLNLNSMPKNDLNSMPKSDFNLNNMVGKPIGSI